MPTSILLFGIKMVRNHRHRQCKELIVKANFKIIKYSFDFAPKTQYFLHLDYDICLRR